MCWRFWRRGSAGGSECEYEDAKGSGREEERGWGREGVRGSELEACAYLEDTDRP